MRRTDHNDPGHAHFLTFSCYHKHQLLTGTRVREWLSESIDAARSRHDFHLWAYVFMPDHVHLLLHPRCEAYSIPNILRDIKQPVSRRFVRVLRRETPWKLKQIESHQGQRVVYRVWQAGGGYDRNLTDMESISRAIEYIEWNPVRRSYVANPVDWFWSSARARAGCDDIALRVDEIGTYQSTDM